MSRITFAPSLRPIFFALCVLASLVPSLAHAQETRADEIAARQAEKAANITTPVPTRVERALIRVQDMLTGPPTGLIPVLDTIYPGGGLTLGVGYQRFLGDRTTWAARGLYSVRNYKLFDLTWHSPGHAHGRVDLAAQAGWRDATQVPFYGLGIDSARTDHTSFRLNQTFVGGTVRARAPGYGVFGGAVHFEDYREREGQGRRPSIGERFTDATAPALGSDPSFLHLVGSAGIDWRPAAGYARRGGLYELRYHNYARTGDGVGFDRLDADVVQHVPIILRETWVVSLHGRLQTTLGDDIVPYFLMPALGSGSSLRAFDTERFRDRHSLLLQGEWRWIPNRFALDLALFYDAGMVAARRSDLALRALKHDVGVGVRFHGALATPLRVELARGSEGWSLVFAGSPVF